MSDERKRCPKCGADFDHVVCDGEVLQFNCGTLQGRTKTERVIESEDCLRRQLAQAKEQLQQALVREAWLRRVVKRVEWAGFIRTEDMTCCPICREPEEVWDRDNEQWVTGTHAPDCELAAALALLDDEKDGENNA